jgi:hypothetical protein
VGAKRRVRFFYPPHLVQHPVIYHLAREYNVVANIRRADVQKEGGWIMMELEGEEADLDGALEWVSTLGIRVDPVDGDVLEG